jgi:hypothetical protein
MKSRKLSVIGQNKTFYLTLPRKMVVTLGWRKGQKIFVSLKGKNLVLRKSPANPSKATKN